MLLVLRGFTPDRVLTVAPGFEGFRMGFPLNDWPCFLVYGASAASCSWVSFNSYVLALLLALYGFEIPLGFAPTCLLNFCFFLPLFFGDVRTDHSTPTCNLKSDFAALVQFCEIF